MKVMPKKPRVRPSFDKVVAEYLRKLSAEKRTPERKRYYASLADAINFELFVQHVDAHPNNIKLIAQRIKQFEESLAKTDGAGTALKSDVLLDHSLIARSVIKKLRAEKKLKSHLN